MDIFCSIRKKLKTQIIDETAHFFIMHDGYPLCEGHLLIVPKKHTKCLANLDRYQKRDFILTKNHVVTFLKAHYCEPVLFEHGIIGQTVLHAHLQVVPTDRSILSVLKTNSVRMKQPRKNYLYYCEKGKEYYFRPKQDIPAGYLHSYLFAPLLKRPQKGIERAQNLGEWYLSVKEKWDITYG